MANTIVNDIRQKIRSGNPVTKLIIFNITVFVIFSLIRIIAFLSAESNMMVSLETFLHNALFLPVSYEGLMHKPWTLITYMFSHLALMHIFWNMLTLYIFGQILLEYTSEKKIVPLYLLGGVVGALFSVVLIMSIPSLEPYRNDQMIGASASVTAIIVGAATLVPEVRVGIPFIGPVKLLYVALFVIFIDVLDASLYDNVAGNFAHLGGAIMGYLFIFQYKKGRDMSKPFNSFFDWLKGLFGTGSKMKVVSKRNLTDEEYNHNRNVNQKQVDEILDKISKSGYESLSKTEKEILFKASKK